MATLEGLLSQFSNARRFTDGDQALQFIDGKKGWHQGREVEYKCEGDESIKLTHIRLTKPGFRPIDVVILEVPALKGKEDKAA